MTAPALTQYTQGLGQVDADGLNTFEQTCTNVSQLRAFIGAVGQQVFTRGYVVSGDGGGGPFVWSASSTADDNGSTIIAPTGAAQGRWIRVGYLPTSLDFNFQGLLNVKDFGALGNGTTDDSGAFQDAEEEGELVFVPNDEYLLSNPVTTETGAWLVSPGVTMTPASWDNFGQIRGPFTDNGNGSNIWRIADRIFGGTAVNSSGSTQSTDATTFIADFAGLDSFYLERSASLLMTSPWGGIGGTFATKASLRYSYLGYGVWASGVGTTAGDKRGYNGRLYVAASSGTTGVTAPTWTTGTQSDGGVSWTFVDYSYQVPIGLAGVAVADVADGEGVWGIYNEVVRTSAGGTSYLREAASKNRGSDVSNNPYSIFPGGSTIGDWFAGGGDATLNPPLNPSTCAILIGKNATTWNKGIVFDALGITGTNGNDGLTGIAIALARGHVIQWYVTGGGVGASLHSDATSANTRTAIVFKDDGIWFLARGAFMARMANDSGTTPANYPKLAANAAGNAPFIAPDGSDTNADFYVKGKGTGGGCLTDINGTVRVKGDSTGLGFFATAPTAQATITGSRGGNAALASLLVELAAKGLILNGTSA